MGQVLSHLILTLAVVSLCACGGRVGSSRVGEARMGNGRRYSRVSAPGPFGTLACVALSASEHGFTYFRRSRLGYLGGPSVVRLVVKSVRLRKNVNRNERLPTYRREGTTAPFGPSLSLL